MTQADMYLYIKLFPIRRLIHKKILIISKDKVIFQW